jgi:hypothetical protein
VTIPNSVTSIGQNAFLACANLTNITVVAGDPDYSSINGVLFDRTQATLIEYPGGLDGGYTIPNSVTAIGEVAFFDCTNLTSVTIPNSVTNIEYAAFRSCFGLTNITAVAGNPDYSSVNGVLFNQAQTTLIEYPGGLGGGYTIPNSVTTIGEPGFADCFHLTSVTIPNSVTSIGQNVFADCPSLTNITVMAGDPDYSSVNGVLFDQTQATLIEYPGGLGGGYTIPNSVTTIGVVAFNDCYSLTSVTIPDSVTSIGPEAFGGCTNLTSAYFLGNAPPDNGTAFTDDPATVYYLAGTTGWGSTFGGVPVVALTSQTQFTFTTNSGAITITGYTGSGGAVLIPVAINGYPVTGIGEGAFGGSGGVTSVTIPNSVTNIGSYAFQDCFSLTSVTIPNSVTTIGVEAFADSGLTSVTIPNSVISIGDYAFASCPSLTNITVVACDLDYSSVNGVLFDQAQATLIAYPGGLGGGYTVPNSVTSIGEGAFFGSDLMSITIPNSVTNIGAGAFQACQRLTSAYFLGNAPPDDGSVFAGDPTTVYYLAGTTGWGSTFGGVPAVLWNPQAQVPGVTAGQFGFGISGPTNATIVVEACTNLVNPVWLPVATNTLSGSGTGTFSDPQAGSYSARYYRFSAP